jgi:hypothetical protein
VLSPAGDDLAPCFELLFRFAAFFYLFVIAALSVAPLRSTPIDRNAIDVNSRTDFVLAALAAVQNLVLVALDFAGVSPLSFPGFPEFRLHYFAAIVAWSISAALLRATAQRHLRVPRHHSMIPVFAFFIINSDFDWVFYCHSCSVVLVDDARVGRQTRGVGRVAINSAGFVAIRLGLGRWSGGVLHHRCTVAVPLLLLRAKRQ